MKNKIFSIVFCVMLLMSIGTIAASANNHGDTPATLNFINGQAAWTEKIRVKEDYSSAYMKCVSSPYSYLAFVIGGIPGEQAIDLSHDGKGGRHYIYRLSQGKSTYLVNYVRERGYTYCAIMATPESTSSYSAQTLWSPDSV